MAFKQLGIRRDEVMTDSHFKNLGKLLGVQFKGIYDEDLGLHLGDGLGDTVQEDSLAKNQHSSNSKNNMPLHL